MQKEKCPEGCGEEEMMRSKWEEMLEQYSEVRYHPRPSMDFWDKSVIGVATEAIPAGGYLRSGPDGNIRLKQAVAIDDEEPQIEEEDICDEAKRITTGDRQNQYGPPDEDFRRTAGMLNSLFADKLREGFLPHEISMIMACLKLSRMSWSPTKRDHHVDLAGYSRTGWLCVQAEIDKGEL